jgi:hypothetical protein
MTVVEPTLVAYLANVPAVTNLIGGPNGHVRLYPNVAPQKNDETGYGQFPHVVYYRVSTARTRTYKGVAGTQPAVVFKACAEDYPTAKAVALAVGEALEGYVGNVPGCGLVKVQGTFLDEESDGYEEPEFADQAGVHTVELTVRVYYSGK